MAVTLYHYTTAEGAEGIMASRYIMPSTNPRYARHGTGVYLTSKSPAGHSMQEISQNNFDGKMRVWKSKKNLGKVRFALEFRFPDRSRVEQADPARDVWRFTGGNLYLEPYFTGRFYYSDPEDGGYKVVGGQEAWYLEA